MKGYVSNVTEIQKMKCISCVFVQFIQIFEWGTIINLILIKVKVFKKSFRVLCIMKTQKLLINFCMISGSIEIVFCVNCSVKLRRKCLYQLMFFLNNILIIYAIFYQTLYIMSL